MNMLGRKKSGRIDRIMNQSKENIEVLEWKEISTEHIIQDEWIDFRKSAYRFPDGTADAWHFP